MTDILETIKGAKNRHPHVRFRCECGSERTTRATKVRRGLVTQCVSCAKLSAARRGGEKRRLPELERLLRDRWSEYKANAHRKGLPATLSFAEASLLLSHACDYCGGPGGGIDRIASSLGYVTGNVASCCAPCNYAKRGMSRAEFLAWVERVHEHQSFLQRNRLVLLRVVEQPDGCGAHPAGSDLRQVDCRSDARRSEAV